MGTLKAQQLPSSVAPTPQIMNDCMADVFNRVAEEAARLTQHGKHVTLTSREVQASGKLRRAWSLTSAAAGYAGLT